MNVHQFPGRKPNMEQQIRDFVKQIKDNFAGGGGGGGANGSGPGHQSNGQNTSLAMWVAIALFVLLWGGFSSYYKVEVSEEGVVTRFGRYLSTSGPGLHFKIPFGVDRVYIVESKRTKQQEFGYRTTDSYKSKEYAKESLMLTGDLNVVDVQWAVQYRIADPWKYLFHARDVTRNVRDVSMSIMRRVVGDRLAGEVLTTGRRGIAVDAKTLTQKVLDEYDMGIMIEQVILQDVNPPDPVKPAFNEVNAAKQEQEEAINNAERQYNKIIPESRGKAEKLIADAEAYKIDIVNRAKGDADRFTNVLREYSRAPAITRQRLYLETMEDIFSKVERFTVVDEEVKGLLPVFNANRNLPHSATTKLGE